MQDRINFEVRLDFEFKDRKPEDLVQINRMLAAMEISEVKMENFDGYMATTRKYDPDGRVVDTNHSYGFDRMTLVCRKQENQPVRRFRICTEVFPGDEMQNHDEYMEFWRERYPERKPSTVSVIAFAEYTAIVMVYFEAE